MFWMQKKSFEHNSLKVKKNSHQKLFLELAQLFVDPKILSAIQQESNCIIEEKNLLPTYLLGKMFFPTDRTTDSPLKLRV